MTEDWLARWREGRIGWHEPDGNAALKAFWPELPARSRVLVPLCGKTTDMLWLAEQGFNVTGVELSPIACVDFFEDQDIEYVVHDAGEFDCFESVELPIRIYCGDYFDFHGEPFDALYDRGSLVTFPERERDNYVAHTKTLLADNARQLLLTLEYEQSAVDGPPWSVPADEVQRHWPGLCKVANRNDIDDSPPKFRSAGLTEFFEVAWLG
ncbi:MAG: thiopurine S-methyltransferase [Gammaproteobacteria bacterium]|nr:thiopurine S-methyltransferase [Gammaproteobacteria bacterium]